HLKQSGFPVADVYVYMTDKTMLCEMGAQCHGMRVAIADAEVDVGQGTVKRAGTGITGCLTGFCHATGKPEHIPCLPFVTGYGLLKAGGIVGQNKFRTLPAITDQPDSCGNID